MAAPSRPFEQALELGHLGERLVVGWLKSRGSGVVPSYDFSGKHGEKAPRLMFERAGLVIPDLDVCRSGTRSWLEVKTFRAPAWNRSRSVEVHGIPERLAKDYTAVELQGGTPVFVAVLEVESGALLIAKLGDLRPVWWRCECQSCQRGWGPCAAPVKRQVYWRRSDMRRVHVFPAEALQDLRARWAR